MTHQFLTSEERDKIVAAIQEAEHNTSGEIRVHLERTCKQPVLDRAAQLFSVLGMQKTEQRNGVLFYVAYEDKKFAILGDAGINSRVPENFWDGIKDQMRSRFKENQYALGLSEGIKEAGLQLKAHFPYLLNDRNELSDELSFGEN